MAGTRKGLINFLLEDGAAHDDRAPELIQLIWDECEETSREQDVAYSARLHRNIATAYRPEVP